MFIDEGDTFEEILEFVKKLEQSWDLDIAWMKNDDVCSQAKQLGHDVKVADLNETNRRELESIDFKEDTFPFEPESYVGNHLMKTVPMKMFIEQNGIQALITAIRWDEQEARINEDFFSPRKNPTHTRIHPILHFRERDVWKAIHQYKIPFCELYRMGYRSLGAKSTTAKVSDLPAWEQDLENTPERAGRAQGKEQIMEKLRELGYM
jgi:phosphoadenosine phosphosulfate reductase